jgi:hypothetical protein
MKITTDPNRNVVVIDGLEVSGFIDERRCPTCGNARIYHENFDAYFCAPCNRWLESRCPDPTCANCKGRPGSPLPSSVA